MEFSTRMTTDINDLPATSPHGSDFGDMRKFLGLHRLRMCHAAHRRHTVAHLYHVSRYPSTDRIRGATR